ncbi:sporulation initiation inhibitor Soj [Sporanaerobium hydrogeniformans]|uniref:Sporulation initiation inhibitor Soj n=1 Tax=Sporanaerobium hydrogeniformans TaxID=3072179 RepID=A0AC61DDC4_9FIRM|nr:AAA family ATPase [Sporanaerobium hydrogeniformans]PHV70612.1 sporulation initiation inhibitor Soj [Sporanaerobium hydrogeniformans]
MGKIIAVVNQKGGVGKTTTVINLAAALVEANYKVLIVDIDPQGNATSGCGLQKSQQETIYDILINESDIKKVIKTSPNEKIDIIASNMNLAGTEVELVNTKKREFILKEQLDKVKDKYDYVFIDCPPAVNILTINALTAANTVLIPMQCEYYALEGLSQLVQTIGLVKKSTNPKLVLEGILFTMYDTRTNLSNQVVKEVETHFSNHVYKTKITRSVRLSEAPSFGMSCISYDGRSKGAEQYRQLSKEFIERNS